MRSYDQRKGVTAIDLITLEEVEEFTSIAEAVRWLGHRKNNISQVCVGRRKSCGGYGWIYKGE